MRVLIHQELLHLMVQKNKMATGFHHIILHESDLFLHDTFIFLHVIENIMDLLCFTLLYIPSKHTKSCVMICNYATNNLLAESIIPLLGELRNKKYKHMCSLKMP
jgi:hypothetical protein